MDAAARRSAFIIFSDLSKIGPYLSPLRDRGVAVLAVSHRQGSAMVQRGIEMLGVSGHPLADLTEIALRDAGDLSGIADQASTWAEDYDIVGVLVNAEVYVEAGQIVSDLLGLPGPGWRAARVCRNKLLQRRHLSEWSPTSVLITAPAERAQAGKLVEAYAGPFPVAVKPLDREGSIGVRVVEDPIALVDVIAALEQGHQILVEERVLGREYTVDSVVIGGKPIATMFTQKGTNEESTAFFVELAHTTPPTNLSEREMGEIVDAQRAILQKLAFGDGFASAEYRITDDGRVVLMEIAARPPGDGLLQMFHLSTGEAIHPVMIDIALGRPATYPQVYQRRVRQIYFEQVPGILADVRVDGLDGITPLWLADTTGVWPEFRPVEKDAPATVHQLFVLKPRGDRLAPLTESSHRAVTAIFDAPLDAGIDAEEARIRQAVAVQIEPV